MAKGQKTGGRQKGTPNKVTSDLREAIAELLDKNADKMQVWLDEVAKDDPAQALGILAKFAEFVVPKMARVQVLTDVMNEQDAFVIAEAERLNAYKAEQTQGVN